MQIPRLIISGLSGGAGKTMVSLGLARAVTRSGPRVRAFKKGPDYIDAAWLALAARAPQANLDPFFLPAPTLRSLFLQGAQGYDLALIEGNRGLFDGLDLSGSCSTAELSRILSAPVLLVLDCTKMTRTAAALVKGCMAFEQGLRIGGVLLNRTGNPRHQSMVRRAIEELAGLPVLGALPRRSQPFIVERHMGLAGLDEYARADAELDALADFMAEHTDLAAISALAASSPDFPSDEALWTGEVTQADEATRAGEAFRMDEAIRTAAPPSRTSSLCCSAVFSAASDTYRPRIGYVRDAAFWFYYEENLAALRAAGAELVPLSLLDRPDQATGEKGEVPRPTHEDEHLSRPVGEGQHSSRPVRRDESGGFPAEVPQAGGQPAHNGDRPSRPDPWDTLDGLYIGGGQPELYARALADNRSRRERVAALARDGLPIYAECGGFMYLSKELIMDGVAFPMAGVFPCSVEFCSRPQGLGYVEAEVVAHNPFHPLGLRFRGHEFHFSRCLAPGQSPEKNAFPSLARSEAQASGSSAAPGPALDSGGSEASGGYVLRLHKGRGMSLASDLGAFDGLVSHNTFASYTHVFAPAMPHWARRFVSLCASRRR